MTEFGIIITQDGGDIAGPLYINDEQAISAGIDISRYRSEGDMLKEVYDTNNNGIVDAAERLTGNVEMNQVNGLGTELAGIESELDEQGTDLAAHISDTDNPHQVSIAQIGASPAIQQSASGDIATFADGAAYPALSAVAMIEPVQEGEGEPYPPGGGKNLCPGIESGGYAAGSGLPISNTNYIRTLKIPVVEGETYTLSSSTTYGPTEMFSWGSDDNFLGSASGASMLNERPAGTAYIAFNYYLQDLEWVQLELGSTATEYAPYANIRPITGHEGCEMVRAGKNLLPNTATTQTINGVTFTVHEDGSITVNGTATNNVYYLVASGKTAFPVGTYVMTGSVPNIGGSFLVDYVHTPSGEYIRAYVDNGNGVTVDVTDPTAQHGFQFHVPNGVTVTNVTIHPMLRLASDTDATYQPYQGTTHTAAFPQTVYGGSYDFVSGKLTVDRAMVTFDGTEEWYANPTQTTGYTRWALNIDDAASNLSSDAKMGNIASHYKEVTPDETYQRTDGFSFRFTKIYIYDTAYAEKTFDDWKAYLAAQYAAGTPVQVCYELASPLTYDLTPQQVDMLFGLNNVWSDTGESRVVYVADTKVYIDAKFAELAAAIVNNA